MTYTFGSKEDLLLTKKIEHWGKTLMTMKKLDKRTQNNKHLREKFEKMEAWYNEQVYNIDRVGVESKQRERAKKTLQIMVCKEFVTKYIIPGMVSSGFFDSYKIPVKKSKKMPDKDNLDRRYTL